MSEPQNLIHLKQNTSVDELKEMVKSANGLVIVDFFATWCPPCQRLGQQLPKLAAEHPNVKFIKVDVELNESLAASFGVSSIPHIVFLKFDETLKTLDTVTGFNMNKIVQNINNFQ